VTRAKELEWEAIDEAKKEFAKANKFTLTKEEEDASEEMKLENVLP
jgi:hypothetical protein